MNAKLKLSLIIIGTIGAIALLHLSAPNIPDPDSLYHIRHAWLYRTVSLFNSDFPWTYYSVLRTSSSDLWYGFHLSLIPFTYFGNLIVGVKVAGIFLTSILFFVYFWAAKRHRLRAPFLWPVLFFFAVPNALFQLLMVRPHMLSLALAILLFSFFIKGKWWQIFLAGLGLAFFHSSFFWVGFLIVFLVFILRYLAGILKKDESPVTVLPRNEFAKQMLRGSPQAAHASWKFDVFKALSLLGGTATGFFLRPNPFSAVKLLYTQVFQLLFEKSGNLPLLFARELSPLSFSTLSKTSALFLLLWASAIIFLFWTVYKQRRLLRKVFLDQWVVLGSSGLFSLIFFFLSLFVARRSYIWWVSFGGIFIGAFYSYVLVLKERWKETASVIMAIFLLMMASYTAYQNGISMARNAMPPERLKEAALWLKDNTKQGEIVFNTHWDNFSALFFWNQNNFYIGGMDPIFQYVYSPSLYWKFHYLSKDEMVEKTCGVYPCEPAFQEDTYAVLVRDFNAKYVLVEKKRNPVFYQFLGLSPKFEKKFENSKEAIFLVR